MKLYLLLFLSGLSTFLSPCILPLLPVYLIYLAGDQTQGKKQLILNTLGFILGFSVLFMALGATASSIGKLLQAHRNELLIGSGIFLILLGVHYLLSGAGWLNFAKIRAFFHLPERAQKEGAAPEKNLHFFSSFLFGIAFCSSWTPCLVTWLASALTLSANAETLFQGVFLLFLFSLGMGLPFMAAALLYGKLKSTFAWLRQNLPKIRLVSGILLILMGVLMISGQFSAYLDLFPAPTV